MFSQLSFSRTNSQAILGRCQEKRHKKLCVFLPLIQSRVSYQNVHDGLEGSQAALLRWRLCSNANKSSSSTLVFLPVTAAALPGFSKSYLGCSKVILLLKCRHLSIPLWGFVLWASVSINRDFGGEYWKEKKPLKYEAILLSSKLIKSVSLGSKRGQRLIDVWFLKATWLRVGLPEFSAFACIIQRHVCCV